MILPGQTQTMLHAVVYQAGDDRLVDLWLDEFVQDQCSLWSKISRIWS